jgi:hypothetical protein
MTNIGVAPGYCPAPRLLLGFLALIVAAAPASAQTAYTWTGGASDNVFGTAGNWTPTGGPPGSNTLTTNTDRALFQDTGSTITAAIGDATTFSLGAIATTASATGGGVNITPTGNGTLRLNGGYTVGLFSNVYAAADGRDLTISSTSVNGVVGSGSNPGQLYASPTHVLTMSFNNLANGSSAPISVEGGGQVQLIGNLNTNNVGLQVNAGVLAVKGNVTLGTGNVQVANLASLQAGTSNGDSQGVGAVTFADHGGIRTLLNASGTTPNLLQNGTYTKAVGDHFRILLSGVPNASGTYTPSSVIMNGTFTGFGSTGDFTQASPGTFEVIGDGFTVTAWSLTLSANTITLNSFSTTPVPEPTGILAITVAGLGGWFVRRRMRRPV